MTKSKKKVSRPVAAKKSAPAKKKPESKKSAAPASAKIARKMLVAPQRKAAAAQHKRAKSVKQYTYDVSKEILPQLKEFRMPSSGRTPASLKDVEGELKPKMVVGGRVYLTKDESLDKMRSLIDIQLQSYH